MISLFAWINIWVQRIKDKQIVQLALQLAILYVHISSVKCIIFMLGNFDGLGYCEAAFYDVQLAVIVIKNHTKNGNKTKYRKVCFINDHIIIHCVYLHM